jgi:glycosyltransferase involved in cell wall biosynthesis
MGSDLLGTRDPQGKIPLLSRLEMALNRAFLPLVDVIIVKSPEMKRKAAPYPAFVVPNGVDTALFRPIERAEARRHLHWPLNKRIILFAGDPQEARKNYPLARQAFELLGGSNDETLEMRVLKDVSTERVPYYMNASSVVWLTSYSEGSPNVVKEAMACSVPVVSVPVGDVAFLLEGVHNSRVVERDPALIAQATRQCWEETAPGNGRERLLEIKLDLNSVALQLKKIYEELMR